MARRLRFEQARDHLCRDPPADLAALAYDCGYTDQAHFGREFKRFSNRTPRQFIAEMLATHQLLRSAGVAFIQDD
jgi:AraC-like DNA-binding protein